VLPKMTEPRDVIRTRYAAGVDRSKESGEAALVGRFAAGERQRVLVASSVYR